MIIAFGDSFTYGFNFNESERLNNVYPTLLGKKLNQPVLNTALPGASNWRIARMIQSMNITKDDIVIISWTEPTRFELGVNKRHYAPPIKENRIGDLNETDGDLITKRFFIQLTDRTTDKDAKKINELVYSEFNNEKWFQEMFKVMYNSCIQVLENSGCKWLMFNAWIKQTDGEYHKNYVYSNTTMSNIIQKHTPGYWNKDEHTKVSDVLVNCLNELYE
jgi:hypothetical protein